MAKKTRKKKKPNQASNKLTDTVQWGIRTTPELRDRVTEWAMDMCLSRDQFMRRLLIEALDTLDEQYGPTTAEKDRVNASTTHLLWSLDRGKVEAVPVKKGRNK